MGVQLSAQIAEEIIKQAEQGESWRRNSEVYQNSLNIVEAAGFGAVLSAPLVRGSCSQEPMGAQPWVLLGCARAGQVTPAGDASPCARGCPGHALCPPTQFSCPGCLVPLAESRVDLLSVGISLVSRAAGIALSTTKGTFL